MAHRRRTATAVLGAGLAGLLVIALGSPALAAPPAATPAIAANYGAGWVARQIGTRGWLPSPTDSNSPDLNTTAYGIIALAAAHAGATQARTALGYLKAHTTDYISPKGVDAPGPLATLILATRALGEDPHTLFGTDLVARLQATRQANGLFGAADPKYDGVYRQGLALAALASVGVTDQAAVDWLKAQQCADGGWVAYRADTNAPCPASDPANFTGEDSNSTAMAVMGLVAQKAAPNADALAWLDATQGTDGGWAYVSAPNQPSDANSTALAIQAILALGGDVQGARFAQGGRTPYDALLAFQLGCADSPTDAGAFAYQPTRDTLTANSLATVQAVPAAAGVALPVAPSALADAVPAVTCAAPAASPATTTPSAPATGTARGTSGTALANTGPMTGDLAALAALLVLAGAALVTLGRPRDATI